MPRIELSELERQKLARAGGGGILRQHGWQPIETAPRIGDMLLWDGYIHIGKYNEEFEKLEVERIGLGKHEEFHHLLHQLKEIYLD